MLRDWVDRLGWLKDLVSALVTAVLCYVGLYSDIQSKMLSRIIRFFSGISYSLYVIHLPLCLLITSWLTGSGNNWGLSYFLLYLFIALVVLGLTVIFWYCFESRYIQVRTYIKKRFCRTGLL
jgi:peptidoglycan/LPS O-acetylase OafA/YrhL